MQKALLAFFSLSILMALFMPNGSEERSTLQRLTWGVSLSPYFIFAVCVVGIITLASELSVLGPIIAYGICGYIFSIFILYALIFYQLIMPKFDEHLLVRGISISSFCGVLSSFVYPVAVIYTLVEPSNFTIWGIYLLLEPQILQSKMLGIFIAAGVLPNILLWLLLQLLSHENQKQTNGRLYTKVFSLSFNASSNLFIIYYLMNAQSVSELFSHIFLFAVFNFLLFVFASLFFRKKNMAVAYFFSKRRALIFFAGALLCSFCFYSFATIVPSSSLFLPFCIVFGLALFLRQVNRLEDEVKFRTNELKTEKEKSDKLLNNVLPKYVIEDLKRDGKSGPKKLDLISVMFTDFVGFTDISNKISPEKLISELNELFTKFDEFTEQYGSERIKTIGDAYMCVSGLKDSSVSPAQNALKIARAIIEYLKGRNSSAEIEWNIRIGIATGPAVGGIVGTKKYLFDLFGDTVNTAARMESHSFRQKINVEQNTYDQLKEFTEFEARGLVRVKGKGKMNMYFVK